jgi:bifunctional N-acetylglucosamine-1-phosphate-uridyltransferase/glucosamine-1-phosphate-acetyltransferase GlmU-like protein
MSGLTLVVMAAGVGSRFGGLKQLEPVGPSGEIILDYSIFDALSAGFSRVAFVIRRELEADFRQLVGRHVEPAADVRYVFQELDALPAGVDPAVAQGRKKPWGTGHAILCCRDAVDGAFVAINADDFYGHSPYVDLAGFLGGADPAERSCMSGYVLGQTLSEHGTVARGVCVVNDDGELREIRELLAIERRGPEIGSTGDDGAWAALPADTVVSMNMWGFRHGLFAELERLFAEFLRLEGRNPKGEFYIPKAVMALIAEGRTRVAVLPTDARWVGVTHRDDVPAVRRSIAALVERGTYPRDLRRALASGELRQG